MISYDLRGIARRVKNRAVPQRSFALLKRLVVKIRAAVRSFVALLKTNAATADEPLARVIRRVEILESHVSRETDRSRHLEASAIIANRATFSNVGNVIERRTSALAERILVLQRELDAQCSTSGELSREVLFEKSMAANTREALDDARRNLDATQRDVAAIRRTLEQTTADVGDLVASIVARLDGLTEGLQAHDAGAPQLVTEQAATLTRLEMLTKSLQEVDADVRELVNRHRATPYMTQPIFPAPATTRDSNAAFDYIGFEDIFRGSKTLVRDRQRAYMQFMRPGQRIIDLGCGRGEFLELARDAGALATGIDTNAEMVAVCAREGFDVREVDALAYLRDVPTGSVDVIFSAQFIEHITPDELYALFVEAQRALAPGGMFIAETVNPHSIEALKCFYIDLSHVKPLFPEVVTFFARSAGFADGRIFYPTGDGFDERSPWNRGEYALVATA